MRYIRWLGESFYFATSVYGDFTVMQQYKEDGNPYTLVHAYKSRATLGIETGIGYFIHKNGLKKPRYFEKWKRKE